MKATPVLILIGVLAVAVVIAFGYAWIETPTPPPVPAALVAAAAPVLRGGDGSPSSVGAAALPAGGGGNPSTLADAGAPAKSWAGAGSGLVLQPGVPADQPQQEGQAVLSQKQGVQDLPEISSASGSAGEGHGTLNSGYAGTKPLIAAGSIPLPPIPPSGQVPLAFRPLAPALSTPNPAVATGLQTIQQTFVGALSGQNQDPNDPGYAARWNAAQLQSDQQYRVLVGNEAYLVEQSSVAGK